MEQVTAEELAEKRKDYLTVKVENAMQAAPLLKKKLQLSSIEIVSPDELHLPDYIETSAVNRVLYSNDFNVLEVFLHRQDLEEYFIELMGGTDHE